MTTVTGAYLIAAGARYTDAGDGGRETDDHYPET